MTRKSSNFFFFGGDDFPRPEPHILDLRSLILFRTFFGLYLCYDVITRIVPFPLSIEWYTSYDSNSNNNNNNNHAMVTAALSLLDPNDTPHGNVLHKIWFARTSAIIQYILFAITFILSLILALGGKLHQRSITRIVLWILVVSMQHRCMFVHDGSDNFTRQLLLWFILLPQQVHDMDPMTLWRYHHRSKHDNNNNNNNNNNSNNTTGTKTNAVTMPISSLACLGLTLQITLMYLGTVANRIYHRPIAYEWMPPELSAVYFVLRDSFAVRDNILVNWMRSQPFPMTQGMTAHAMIAEMSSIVWFLCPNNNNSITTRYWGFWMLFTLHFGLLLVVRLPNWQLVAMTASILWIPTGIWDNETNTTTATTTADDASADASAATTTTITAPASSKGGNDDETTTNNGSKDSTILENHHDQNDNNNSNNSSSSKNNNDKSNNKLRQIIMIFFLVHMIYNFAAERQWIPKYDGGDIGEFFRISQYWVMYSTAPRNSATAHIIGYRKKEQQEQQEYEEEWIDVMQLLQTNKYHWNIPWNDDKSWKTGRPTYPENPAIVSPRWERALSSFSTKRDRRRILHLLRAICRSSSSNSSNNNNNNNDKTTNADATTSTKNVDRVEYAFFYYHIVPPDMVDNGVSGSHRWEPHGDKPDHVFTWDCSWQ